MLGECRDGLIHDKGFAEQEVQDFASKIAVGVKERRRLLQKLAQTRWRPGRSGSSRNPDE